METNSCKTLAFISMLSWMAVASEAYAAEKWVTVVRPMMACREANIPLKSLESVFITKALPRWQNGLLPPETCKPLKLGEVFVLDPDAKQENFLSLLEICGDCVPFATKVLSPSRAMAGDYLRPIKRPAGYQRYLQTHPGSGF